MDPDETYEKLKVAVTVLRLSAEDDKFVPPCVVANAVSMAVENFDALDEWLTAGGFVPRQWKASQDAAIENYIKGVS